MKVQKYAFFVLTLMSTQNDSAKLIRNYKKANLFKIIETGFLQVQRGNRKVFLSNKAKF